MRVRTDPLTLAVALGLLGPSVLQEGSTLEVHPDDAEQLVRVARDAAPLLPDPVGTEAGDTVSYEVALEPELGAVEE